MKFVKSKFQSVKPEKWKQVRVFIYIYKGSMIKARNEPCNIIQVLEVIAKIKEVSEDEVAKACFQNSLKLLKL
jgi:TatD DNase family protein